MQNIGQSIKNSLVASAIADHYVQALGDDAVKFIDESVTKTDRGTTIYTLELIEEEDIA